MNRVVIIETADLEKVADAIRDVVNDLVAAINEAWQPVADALEEIMDLLEEYADIAAPEEEDRNDGAVVVLAVWLPLAPTLYELYGQGVDHGGPGPSRLTLIRVTDDGLWRAETGTKQERRQQNEETQGLQHGRSC